MKYLALTNLFLWLSWLSIASWVSQWHLCAMTEVKVEVPKEGAKAAEPVKVPTLKDSGVPGPGLCLTTFYNIIYWIYFWVGCGLVFCPTHLSLLVCHNTTEADEEESLSIRKVLYQRMEEVGVFIKMFGGVPPTSSRGLPKYVPSVCPADYLEDEHGWVSLGQIWDWWWLQAIPASFLAYLWGPNFWFSFMQLTMFF